MTSKPDILQGTDGIRGRISTRQSLDNTHPLDFFLETGFLTPEFFECYTFAFATLLIDANLARENENVVIGWDPRDRQGNFNRAAIAGIRKAGLNAIVAGTLPTPAMPLYMLSIDAAASVVLTASHNPADQNGIKLFCGHTALKLLPADDITLTDRIHEQKSFDLSKLKETGGFELREQRVKDFFVTFCLDPRNSWIDTGDFKDSILVVDASNGAVATVAEPVFSALPFQQVEFTNMEGHINERCGVADIEGMESISRDMVSSPDGRFSGYQTLDRLFELATKLKQGGSPGTSLIGLVFDGDGDRCYRLDYIPERDRFHVSSGDLLGIHQARYLLNDDSQKGKLFVNTVESDLNTAITARDMGYEAVLTGVGDKWILSRAVLDQMQASLPENQVHKESFQAFTEKENGLSAIDLSAWWQEVRKENVVPEKDQRKYAIGLEESGHCITPGYFDSASLTTVCFSGNGIKTALNSVMAMAPYTGKSYQPDAIEHPFEAGVRKTFYTYYVDKSRLKSGQAFRNEIQSTLIEQFKCCFPETFEMSLLEFSEEKEMIYCSISENQKQCGAIFMRNSGTEDKSALYLRGEARLQTFLEDLGFHMHLSLLRGQKNHSHPFVEFELKLLKAVERGDSPDTLLSQHKDLPCERILKEMELKEGLLMKSDGVLSLTGKGKSFLDFCV